MLHEGQSNCLSIEAYRPSHIVDVKHSSHFRFRLPLSTLLGGQRDPTRAGQTFVGHRDGGAAAPQSEHEVAGEFFRDGSLVSCLESDGLVPQ
jgi:hypothetical protein